MARQRLGVVDALRLLRPCQAGRAQVVEVGAVAEVEMLEADWRHCFDRWYLSRCLHLLLQNFARVRPTKVAPQTGQMCFDLQRMAERAAPGLESADDFVGDIASLFCRKAGGAKRQGEFM